MQPKARSLSTGIAPNELDPQRPRLIETPWGVMALYRIGDEILCAAAFCPHLEGPLFEGTLSGATITCPWHQWRFDLRSGRRLTLFGAHVGEDRVARCQVQLDAHGAIVLLAPESSSPP